MKILLKLVLFLLALILFSVSAQSQSSCSSTTSIHDTFQTQSGILLVGSNSAQAGFTVTGPAIYRGTGYSWVEQAIPAGTYTITWNSMPGCSTPPPETKTTNANGSVAFAGNYIPSGGNALPSPTPLPTPYPTTPYPAAPLPTIKPQIKTTPYTTPHTVPTAIPQKLSGKAKLAITSVPDGAMIYVNNTLVGKAPLTYQVEEGSQQIHCVLEGYDNYYYGVAISDSGAKSGIIVKVVCRMQPSSSGPGNRIQNLPQDNISSPNPIATPSKPKGVFSRIWQSFFSLFGR